MRQVLKYAIFSAVCLLLFLLIRPIIGRLGDPVPPEIRGASDVDLAEELPSVTELAETPRSITPMPPRSVAGSQNLTAVEQAIFRLTNEARQQNGRAPLLAENDLRRLARDHGLDMCERRFFDHTNPDGLGPADRIAMGHRSLIGLSGENIWMSIGMDTSNSERLAARIVKDWLDSPGHRANILREDFTHLGVGVVKVDDGVWATQKFAGVYAYLNYPLPQTAARGSRLTLDHRPAGANQRNAEKFDLWSTRLGRSVTDPMNLNDPMEQVSARPYKLRFLFPDEEPGSYIVVYGPQIEVLDP